MTRSQRIHSALQANLSDLQISIEDESSRHAHGGNESHLKLLLVSSSFKGMNRVQRQRRINELVAVEFQSGLHALSMRCLTPEEAEENSSEFKSPDCAGGSGKH